MLKYKVWVCKIVVPGDAELPGAFDGPPRNAAINAVQAAGVPVLNCFSQWGGDLSNTEKLIVEADDYESRR